MFVPNSVKKSFTFPSTVVRGSGLPSSAVSVSRPEMTSATPPLMAFTSPLTSGGGTASKAAWRAASLAGSFSPPSPGGM